MLDPYFIKLTILGIITLSFLFDEILAYVNLRHNKKPLPETLSDIYDDEKYQNSLQYHEALAKFSFFTSTLSFLTAFALIALGWFGLLDFFVRQYFSNEVTQALAFFGILFLAGDILTIPFQWYSTFVIEEKYGFNKTTVKTFITDKLKGYVLTIILGGTLLALLIYLILYFGKDFWIYFWIAASVFMLMINIFYTTLILPLFNKLTPLEDGELKKAIENYARQVQFPLKNIFVIDGSKRSSKSNAFFAGLGKKKKVVLYDTLIENHTTEELVAILAHEIGHYKKKHIIQAVVISLIQTGLILYILSLFVFNTDISLALGSNKTSIHLNLLAFGILFSPISEVIGVIMNVLSRKNEFEADAYAKKTYNADALILALKKLSQHNLSSLMPHPWYVYVNYSHPPLKDRIEALSD